MDKIIKPSTILKNYDKCEIYIANDIFNNLVNIINQYPNSLVITDQNIYEKLLVHISGLKCKILPKNIKAEKILAEQISQEISAYNFAIAIGSGTINDIVKYASYLANKPYIIFATAPSMNGYYSEYASLIHNDLKQSFKAQIALSSYFDLKILADAPIRLIQSGLGDSICSTISRADWLLSHYILNSYYSELPFELTYKLEEKLFAQTNLLVKRNPEAISLLTEILIYSGLAMTYCKGSYPASQGEHMIAHLYEMFDPKISELLYHGEQIAVTSLSMISLQEKLINLAHLSLKNNNTELKSHNFKIAKQQLDIEKTNQILDKKWPELQKKILNKFRSKKQLEQILTSAAIDLQQNKDIFDHNLYEESLKNAFLTRDRFTFLDLAHYL